MTREIILTISGIHATDGEKAEPIEILTPGQYYLKNGKHYVLFEEMMEGIDGKIRSTLKFQEDKVELIRNGAASVHMVFQKEQEHQMIYRTPMGPMAISLYTEDIIADINGEQMNLEIRYSLKAEGAVISESTLHLNVCPKEVKRFADQT